MPFQLIRKICCLSNKYVIGRIEWKQVLEKHFQAFCCVNPFIQIKIEESKMGAFFKEQALTAKAFVKDAGKSVEQYLKENGDVKVTEFRRVALGYLRNILICNKQKILSYNKITSFVFTLYNYGHSALIVYSNLFATELFFMATLMIFPFMLFSVKVFDCPLLLLGNT